MNTTPPVSVRTIWWEPPHWSPNLPACVFWVWALRSHCEFKQCLAETNLFTGFSHPFCQNWVLSSSPYTVSESLDSRPVFLPDAKAAWCYTLSLLPQTDNLEILVTHSTSTSPNLLKSKLFDLTPTRTVTVKIKTKWQVLVRRNHNSCAQLLGIGGNVKCRSHLENSMAILQKN